MKTGTPFSLKVDDTDANIVSATGNPQIWKEKAHTISKLSQDLEEAFLFQLSYEVTGETISIKSDKIARVYIALTNDPNDEVSSALVTDKWESENKLNLEYLDKTDPKVPKEKPFGKILSKKIVAGGTVILKRADVIPKPGTVHFTILIKEG